MRHIVNDAMSVTASGISVLPIYMHRPGGSAGQQELLLCASAVASAADVIDNVKGNITATRFTQYNNLILSL